MSNRIIHFEIQVENPERAATFYRTVFGWEIEEWKGDLGGMRYWMVMTAPKDSKEPGINGGLLIRPKVGGTAEVSPALMKAQGCAANAFVCTVIVDDIDATGAAIEKAGGTVAMPKYSIAGMAWQAYYHDLEGNVFGIHQPIKPITGKGM